MLGCLLAGGGLLGGCALLGGCGLLGDTRVLPTAAAEGGDLNLEAQKGQGVAPLHSGSQAELPQGGDPAARAQSADKLAPAQSAEVAAPAKSAGRAGPGAGGDDAEQARAAPRAAWRFQAASPSSGAAGVAANGDVYFSTVEGYVHALSADGHYRWSHGLSSLPIGGPVVDRAGRVYVATNARRLYALRSDGELAWVHRASSRIATEPSWAAPGVLFFAGSDERLYAVASWGSQLWSRHLSAEAAGAPASLGGGWLGVPTANQELWLFRGSALVSRVALPAVSSQPLLAGQQHWFVVAGGELLALAKDRKAPIQWRSRARQVALSPGAEWLVAEADRELRWLSPATGKELHRSGLPDLPSASPAVLDSGVALVPLVSGELLIVNPLVQSSVKVKVATGPLRQPIWSERTRSAIAVAGNGTVLSVDLRGWSRRPQRPRSNASEEQGVNAVLPRAPSTQDSTSVAPNRGGGV